MFGVYSNKRLSENEREILHSHPDDYNWYSVIVNTVFKDTRFFQVREDIELPKKEDDDGVVLIFDGGEVVYFKTLDGDVTDGDVDDIVRVCSYLEETFNQHIKAYVLCRPGKKLNFVKKGYEVNLDIFFSNLSSKDGEKIIDKLEKKLINHQKFTIPDSIEHMLLPYSGYKNKEVFDEKFKHYMDLIDSVNAN